MASRGTDLIPVVQKSYDLCAGLYTHVNRFPRAQRGLLGRVMLEDALQMLVLMTVANRRAEKGETLAEASGRLDALRITLRRGKRLSGLLHALLGIDSFDALGSHPKLGASWEGFAIEQILAMSGEQNVYYWGTQSGAELDLLLTVDGKRIGVEIKYADAPRATRSMQVAMKDLDLSALYVVHPGKARYGLGDRVEAIGLAEILSELGARGRRARRPRRQRAPGE